MYLLPKRHIASIILLFFCILIYAQPRYRISNYSVNEGLSQKIVSDILQDNQGFMWFSTWNGLSRFDGYTIVNYRKSADGQNIPLNNRIDFIRENTQGDIWCCTNDRRAYLFNVKSGCYTDVLKPIEQKMKRQYEVTAIYPLKKGVTWIVCNQGIAFRIQDDKYMDSESIEIYSHYDKTLVGEIIYRIVQNTDGSEWILTNKGVIVEGNNKFQDSTPFRFIEIQDNKVLLLTENGVLATYDTKAKKLKHINIPNKINRIKKVQHISNGTYAIIANGGLLIYNSKRGTHTYIDEVDNDKLPPIKDVYYNASEYLWLFTDEPLVLKMNIQTKSIEKIRFEDNQSKVLVLNNKSQVYELNKTLWCITEKGHSLAYYDEKSNTLKNTTVDSNGQILGNNWLRGMAFTDNQQNIWIPAISGVTKITFLKNSIQHIELDKNLETRSFMFDKHKRLWVGTKAGIVRVFDQDFKLIGYLSRNGHIVPQKIRFSDIDLGIYSIMEDSKGNVWIGSKGCGLYKLNPKDANSQTFSVENHRNKASDPYSLSHNNVYSIFEDNKNRIWVGTYNGGLNLIEDHDKIKFINKNNSLKNYPIDDFLSVRYISESKNGIIFVGTTKGLLTFSANFKNPAAITFFKNQPNLENKTALQGYNVMQSLSDKKGNVYVITSDGGINKIISKNLLSENIEFERLTKINSSTILDLNLSILEDSKHNLWGLTENSIARINSATGDINVISRNLLTNDCYFTEAMPLFINNKHLVVATGNGMMIIDPDEMSPSNYAPPIAFTDIESQGEHLTTDDEGVLSLSPSQRNISINFAALDYIYAKDICYAYRMIGIDSSWTYVDKNRSVSYVNLPKGKYYFQVKSTNSDGIWQDNITTLVINVKPKFSETYWAILLYILIALILATVVMYTIFYIYRLRYNLNFEQQLADIKLRFFTDISHELRTPLTLISGPVTEVIENENLSPTAKEYLNIVKSNVSRMLLLINQILDFRKMQNKRMKLLVENVDLVELTKKAMLDFNFIAEEKQIQFNIESSNDSILCWVDTDKFKKILFNLLSNAFKFTPNAKSITVKLEETESEVSVSVIDQGVGINSKKISTIFERFENYTMYNSEQPSSGIGLSLVRELSNLHHAKITVDSAEKKGSEFRITFPKGVEYLQNDPNVEFILSDEMKPDGETSKNFASEIQGNSSNTDSDLTILVVEDNLELQNFLISILSPHYKVISASNGNEGYLKANEIIPDFILTDVVMKEMDGLEMVKKIKEDVKICHIPIVVLSSKSSLDDRVKGLEYGIDDYITKPFSATYLKTRIAMLINQRKQLQKLYVTAITESDINSIEISPSQPQIISSDKVFMQQLIDFMEENIDNTELTIDTLADAMNQSRSIFYRKIKSILGISPIDFIRKIRIKRAIQLIESDEYTLSQIAYMTGFSDPKYFGKCFKKETGKNPSEYKAQ